MKKPEYISKLELNEEVFSVLKNQDFLKSLSIFDENKNLELIYSESEFVNKKIEPISKLYKTKSGFYLYVEKATSDNTNYALTIYYKPKQLSEITVFLLQLNKK